MRLDRPPLKLLFKNPVFADGAQSTVRLGTKWRDDLRGEVGKRVPVADTESGEVVGQATILGTIYGKYSTVANISTGCQHDEDCRDIKGLNAAMERAYGDKFNPDTAGVTVVFFTLSKNEPESSDAEAEADEETEEAA